MDCVRDCIIEKFPEYKKDLSVEQWRMIDAGEKYGRIRYNEALEDLKRFTDAGWLINSSNIESVIEKLKKHIE